MPLNPPSAFPNWRRYCQYAKKSRRQLRPQLWAWRAESLGGVGRPDDARIFGRSDPAAVLCLVSRGVGETWQQTVAVGAHARAVFRLCSRVDATAARSSVLRLEEVCPAVSC